MNRNTHKVSSLALIASLLITIAAGLSPSLAVGAQNELCEGFPIENRFTELGGRHTSISEGAVADSMSRLQTLVARYESDLRQAMTSLGMGGDVADALFAQVARDEGISETRVDPGDSFEWMAFRRKGEPATVSPICIASDQSYDSYQVDVTVGRGATTEAYRFLLPKICLNLAFAGKRVLPSCQVTTPEEAETGERFSVDVSGDWTSASVVVVDNDGQTVRTLSSPYPQTVVLDEPGIYRLRGEAVNDAGDTAQCASRVNVTQARSWTIRAYAVNMNPDDDEIVSTAPGLRQAFQTNSGWGGGVSVEYRLNDRLGIEASAIFAQPEARMNVDTPTAWEHDMDELDFASITVGPNFHFYRGDRIDLFAGPFVGWANLGDVELTVADLGVTQNRDLDDAFVWGGRVGSDVGFSEQSPWKLHLGLMYMDFETEDEETDEEMDLDPLLFQVGIARDL